MATRSRKTSVDQPATAPARKTATPRSKPAPAPTESPEGLLRAGLKALGEVRNDVVRHHTNAIERLLGIQRSDTDGAKPPAPSSPLGLGALEGFGLRKFEDVFDQRVATALQRLGMPSAVELQALRDEVQQLRAQRDAAQAAATPVAGPAPKRKR